MQFFIFPLLFFSTLFVRGQFSRELNAAVHLIPNDYEIGSGFVYSKKGDSLNVVTAKHVIEFAELQGQSLVGLRTVFISNDTVTGGKLLLMDDSLDLAVIRIKKPVGWEFSGIALDTELNMFKGLHVASTREGWMCIPSGDAMSYVYSCCTEFSEAEMAMNGIFPGHSGSMVFSQQGISGIVVRNSENLVYIIPSVFFAEILHSFN